MPVTCASSRGDARATSTTPPDRRTIVATTRARADRVRRCRRGSRAALHHPASSRLAGTFVRADVRSCAPWQQAVRQGRGSRIRVVAASRPGARPGSGRTPDYGSPVARRRFAHASASCHSAVIEVTLRGRHRGLRVGELDLAAEPLGVARLGELELGLRGGDGLGRRLDVRAVGDDLRARGFELPRSAMTSRASRCATRRLEVRARDPDIGAAAAAIPQRPRQREPGLPRRLRRPVAAGQATTALSALADRIGRRSACAASTVASAASICLVELRRSPAGACARCRRAPRGRAAPIGRHRPVRIDRGRPRRIEPADRGAQVRERDRLVALRLRERGRAHSRRATAPATTSIGSLRLRGDEPLRLIEVALLALHGRLGDRDQPRRARPPRGTRARRRYGCRGSWCRRSAFDAAAFASAALTFARVEPEVVDAPGRVRREAAALLRPRRTRRTGRIGIGRVAHARERGAFADRGGDVHRRTLGDVRQIDATRGCLGVARASRAFGFCFIAISTARAIEIVSCPGPRSPQP